MHIDDRQQHLIDGWIAQAQQTTDPYFRFISLWIAFNAACYARFYTTANQLRADLKDLEPRPAVDGDFEAQVQLTIGEGVVGVKVIANKLKLHLKIAEKYTEDSIFSAFAKEMQTQYCDALDGDSVFNQEIDAFLETIEKPNGHYVLNLSHENITNVESWDSRRVKAGSNLLRSFHDKRKLSLLTSALYQVRCNVFHGEKTPGVLNDDRIVIAASPVLESLLDLR